MDTDWCLDEVLDGALSLLRERYLPCTVFATGPYAALQRHDPARLEIGLHPNFTNTTSENYEARLRELCALYPHANGIACHTMMSSNPLLALFKNYGFIYDRNLLRYKDAHAEPFQHHNGLVRLPVFWEDDIWFSVVPGAPFSAELLRPERFHYIFNFHPIHLHLNTMSQAHYLAFKPVQHELEKLALHAGRGYGVRSFFMDLVDHVQKQGIATELLGSMFR